MAAKTGSRPRTKDGGNEFASASGVAPKRDNLSELLARYVPCDPDAFARLTKPSLKAQAQALDVAKVRFVAKAYVYHAGAALSFRTLARMLRHVRICVVRVLTATIFNCCTFQSPGKDTGRVEDTCHLLSGIHVCS
jgi:hypothetical protein